MPASRGEHTTPSRPASFVLRAYFTIVSSIEAPMSSSRRMRSSLVEVSCVTAISSGRVPSSRVSPSRAAFIISIVPAAWTLHMSTSRRDSTAIAFFTVLGMSCSFRSRKIRWPRRLISRTIEGPSA